MILTEPQTIEAWAAGVFGVGLCGLVREAEGAGVRRYRVGWVRCAKAWGPVASACHGAAREATEPWKALRAAIFRHE